MERMSSDPSSVSTARLPENPPLSALEARVLGCLIEKEFSTPDIYPLSLNALVNACNQKNNRDPVIAVGNTEVEQALGQLRQRRLAALVTGGDARVPKFRQTVDNSYPLDAIARALMGELLLRGPQTIAALRANAERLCAIPDAAEVEQRLADLGAREAGALVQKLPRQPGQKEARWAQLLTGIPADTSEPAAGRQALPVEMVMPPAVEERLRYLESQVADLRAEIQRLRADLGGA